MAKHRIEISEKHGDDTVEGAQEFFERAHYELFVKNSYGRLRKQAKFAKNWTYIPQVKSFLESRDKGRKDMIKDGIRVINVPGSNRKLFQHQRRPRSRVGNPIAA